MCWHVLEGAPKCTTTMTSLMKTAVADQRAHKAGCEGVEHARRRTLMGLLVSLAHLATEKLIARASLPVKQQGQQRLVCAAH